MNRPGPDSPDQSANKDDDAVWLDLVARLESMPSSPLDEPRLAEEPPKDPGTEPGPGPDAVPGTSTSRSFQDFDPLGLARRGAADEPGAREGDGSGATGPRDFDVEDEGGFVPEDPPSLAGTEPLTMLAWLGAVGGPLALLFTAMFWRSAPLLAVMGILAAFLASVVYLIMKLPQEKDENDDGARV
ncbi:hypothetical protein [Arthrobacter sp. MMS18-M83]|uniref:hypothetical protein n=1 Tax=Arthrobacter sp. MMS18-M83 TaxID=2996261 RepID=UPI00227AB63D|nr:hypothetical protein [Arthrobacter sp. MMS18-M83]WAH97931.1 hypothetical protein OW521_03305 [Arthrobacter sp. MMS18-M83]